MKTNQNYLIKIINTNRLKEKEVGDKKFRTIKVETGSDLINTIQLLVELLKISYEVENDKTFDEIYKKCKN